MKYLLQSIALLIVALYVICLLCENSALKKDRQGVDTVEYIETIPYLKPIPVDSVVLRYETVKLPVGVQKTPDNVQKMPDSVQKMPDSVQKMPDSVQKMPDSVEVQIPITQKIYKDSTYEAWVSGYHPKMDSIRVFSTTKVITVKSKPKRWRFGIQGGYGYTPKGFQPYLGIGGSYNF